MAQPFSLRYLLVDGQGNFGSIDGDNAAAMRYTEARMSRISHELMADIDKDTVDFQPNYDEKELEPTVMPARVPNLLINGSGHRGRHGDQHPAAQPQRGRGRAAGAARRPADRHRRPDAIIPGPGFPHRRHHQRRRRHPPGVQDRPRPHPCACARAEVEVADNGREAIVVTEIPYQVNKARLIEKIAELVKEKKLDGISELRDESDKDGMRIYIEVKRGDSAEVVLNNLYSQTPMESTFGINMVALVDGRPQLLNLKQILEAFVRHRREVVVRRTIFELRKARNRAHILEGLTVALANIDAMIELIKTSENPQVAKERMLARAGSRPGRHAARRRRRRGLAPGGPAGRRRPARRRLPAHRDAGAADPGDAPAPPDRAGAGKMTEEYRELLEEIRGLIRILEEPEVLLDVIRTELRNLKGGIRGRAPFRNPRFGGRSRHPRPDRAGRRGRDALARRLRQAPAGDRVPRAAPRQPRAQRGGDQGRGFHRPAVAGQHPRHAAHLHQQRPRVLAAGAPAAGRRPARARQADHQLDRAGEGEKVQAVLPVREYADGHYVFFATRDGTVKKTR